MQLFGSESIKLPDFEASPANIPRDLPVVKPGGDRAGHFHVPLGTSTLSRCGGLNHRPDAGERVPVDAALETELVPCQKCEWRAYLKSHTESDSDRATPADTGNGTGFGGCAFFVL
jgi:hypothetical protein